MRPREDYLTIDINLKSLKAIQGHESKTTMPLNTHNTHAASDDLVKWCFVVH